MHCKLLLATNNQAKVREYRSLLSAVPYELVTPGEVGITTTVEETGGTFAENARLRRACSPPKAACGRWRMIPAWRLMP